MMERHRCNLCFRSFANGRSLGGHMRSHMMNIYAAKVASKGHDFHSVQSYSSESSFLSEEDVESETESLMKNQKSPIGRRSKRVRKSGFLESSEVKNSKFGIEPEPLSSISDTTSDEDVAHCLMMLSRDKWRRVEMEFQEKEEEVYDNSEDSYGVGKVMKNKFKGKYRCETCNKLFRSYQALGGHRANHNKIKLEAPPRPGRQAVVAEEKIHECPFCERVFPSGQALGGHKRSHFLNGGAISKKVSSTSPVKQISRTGETLDIDLNLPAPDDEDDGISQFAISAVSE